MDSVVLFLNDRSYPLPQSDDESRIAILKNFIQAIARARMLERPLSVGAAAKISDLPITSDHQTVANFAARVDRDWWRLVRGVDQYVPFGSTPGIRHPADSRHVVDDEEVSEAVLWAEANDALMLSFGSTTRLSEHSVQVSLCGCGSTDHVPELFSCANISSADHVDHWRDRILDFRRVESASSEIYRCEAFSIRMFLDDHEPPHVHIFVPDSPTRWVAKVRVDFVETQKNRGLNRRIERTVLDFIEARREDFLRAWARRSVGMRPNSLGDGG